MDKRDKCSPLLPRLHEGGDLNVWGMVTSDCDQAWLAISVNKPDNPSREIPAGRTQCWDAGTSVALTAPSCSVDEVSSLQLFLQLLPWTYACKVQIPQEPQAASPWEARASSPAIELALIVLLSHKDELSKDSALSTKIAPWKRRPPVVGSDTDAPE